MLLPCDVCAAADVRDVEVWILVSNAVVDRRPPAYMKRLISRVSKEPQEKYGSQRRSQVSLLEC